MAIFITGDTHGDFFRLGKRGFRELNGLTKEDYVIICGDFGGVWCDSKEEQATLDWLDGRPFTTLFISGNHENYDLLARYPLMEWNGGLVQAIRPSILHLTRGQVFTLAGKTFFTMGGASSHDVSDGILDPKDPLLRRKVRQLNARGALFRIDHLSWWKEELPSEAEQQAAMASLDRVGWKVDYIVTHCAPTSIQQALSPELYQPDRLTDFLEEIQQRCTFSHWFFGHYHDNKAIGQKFILLYEDLIELPPDDAVR